MGGSLDSIVIYILALIIEISRFVKLNTLGTFIGFGAFKVLSGFSFFKNNIDL